MLRCEGQSEHCVILALPQLLGASSGRQRGFLLWDQRAALPSGCRGEHTGPFSWEHMKLSSELVTRPLMFLPLLGDTAAADNCLCFCQLQ